MSVCNLDRPYAHIIRVTHTFSCLETIVNISQIKSKHPKHWRDSSAIRILSADAVHAAASGHQGMPIGMADVATVLFQNHLKFDAKKP